MTMDATKARLGLFKLSMLVLVSLVVADAVWAQGEVSFLARRDFPVGGSPESITVVDLNGDGQLYSARD
jgi:ABC-type glucose/galactose transport system permease subunit